MVQAFSTGGEIDFRVADDYRSFVLAEQSPLPAIIKEIGRLPGVLGRVSCRQLMIESSDNMTEAHYDELAQVMNRSRDRTGTVMTHQVAGLPALAFYLDRELLPERRQERIVLTGAVVPYPLRYPAPDARPNVEQAILDAVDEQIAPGVIVSIQQRLFEPGFMRYDNTTKRMIDTRNDGHSQRLLRSDYYHAYPQAPTMYWGDTRRALQANKIELQADDESLEFDLETALTVLDAALPQPPVFLQRLHRLQMPVEQIPLPGYTG